MTNSGLNEDKMKLIFFFLDCLNFWEKKRNSLILAEKLM